MADETTTTAQPVDPNAPAGGNGGTPAPAAVTPPADQRSFSQQDVDAIIADRLARQQRALDARAAKDRADAEAATLAEQGKYKELAEKAERKAADLETRIAQRDHADLQRDVATEHNLPAAMAARLQGTTREELDADAKALAALVTAPPPPPVPGNRPNPRPQSGPDAAGQTEREMRASGKYAAL